MIWPKVALSAGARLSGDRHRTGMTGMACRAGADRAIVVRLPDAVTLFASAGHCRWPFKSREGMRWTFDSSRLVGLGKIHLFRSKCSLSAHSGPRYGGVAAVQELLIDVFMAAPAIAGSKGADDGKPVVSLAFLSIRRLVAVQAIDALLRMFAHFVFVDD